MAETTSCARCELTLVRASDNGQWIDLDGLHTCPYGACDATAEHQPRTVKETATIWVCTDCLMAEANGDLSGADEEMQAKYPAMGKLAAEDVSHGMWFAQHSCGRENGEDIEECECETDSFSRQQCDGCGSPYAGERHAMTLWFEANNA